MFKYLQQLIVSVIPFVNSYHNSRAILQKTLLNLEINYYHRKIYQLTKQFKNIKSTLSYILPAKVCDFIFLVIFVDSMYTYIGIKKLCQTYEVFCIKFWWNKPLVFQNDNSEWLSVEWDLFDTLIPKPLPHILEIRFIYYYFALKTMELLVTINFILAFFRS